MLQLADRLEKVQPSPSAGPSPLARMAGSVASFAAGCGVAAGMFRLAGHWCFAVPPVLIAGAAVLAGKQRG
ncbi:hypothetical protein [Paraburkholderia strydomiana]|uniref:hypothetical protein n=1 Tax=Paraburkholderia strydomiana TaxID=1245417 RepID=UPI001BE7AE2E|nr:hypothetical protein [Paraburkholderia strydomiana]MBT2794954.1 hypothetical protein [Paraburkholderia strydomiana]